MYSGAEMRTGKCPTGVTTHNKWLVRGLDPTSKGVRLANYLIMLRKEIKRLCHAGGVAHPALITLDHFEIMDSPYSSRNAREIFGYTKKQDLPGAKEKNYVQNIYLNKS